VTTLVKETSDQINHSAQSMDEMSQYLERVRTQMAETKEAIEKIQQGMDETKLSHNHIEKGLSGFNQVIQLIDKASLTIKSTSEQLNDMVKEQQ